MGLDVSWDGVPLATGAPVREQDGGWFVELEQPMPVGTTLLLTGDVSATVRVARVHEGAGAGMLLQRADARPAAAEAHKAEAKAAPAEARVEPPSDPGDDEPAPEKNGGGGGKKERKRKKSKTVIGH